MNDSLIEVLGWIGFLFILFGYFLNAKKNIKCFYVWAFGNILYFSYGYFLNAIPIMAMSIFILGMNLYGYKNWK